MHRSHHPRTVLAPIRTVVIVLVAGALLATGCRSTPSAPSVSLRGKVNRSGDVTIPTAAGNRPVVLEMELRDNSFKPTIVRLTEGMDLTVRVHNVGTSTHTFTVPTLHVDTELRSDTSRETTLRNFGRGQIPFLCRFHRAVGMQGGFLVLEAKR